MPDNDYQMLMVKVSNFARQLEGVIQKVWDKAENDAKLQSILSDFSRDGIIRHFAAVYEGWTPFGDGELAELLITRLALASNGTLEE